MAVVAVVLIAASWTVTRTTSDYLLDQVDAQLIRFASGPGGDGPRVPPPGSPPSSESRPPSSSAVDFSSVYAAVVVGDTLEERLSPGHVANDIGAPRIDAATAVRLASEDTVETVDSTVDGERYRVTAVVGDSGEVIVMGMPLDSVDAAIDRLVVTEVIATISVLLVLGIILWWVLRLGVRPVRRMTEAATTIAAGDLSQRVPEEAPGTEAHGLGVALNTMLGRIEAAFDERVASEERLRRFVADASHELRTPVTTVRGYAELYRLGGLTDPDRLDAAMTRTEAESIRMGRLVEDLLTLARLDQGQTGESAPIALDQLVVDAVEDLRVRHPAHAVTLRAEPVTIIGDADQIHQVAANLLTNAAVHTPPGTGVDVEVSVDGDHARLVVRDHGPGMDEESATHAFERFWRADPSRSRSSGGSGLGLSIVASIVASVGGSVRLERPVDGVGTAAVVEFPIADGPQVARSSEYPESSEQ